MEEGLEISFFADPSLRYYLDDGMIVNSQIICDLLQSIPMTHMSIFLRFRREEKNGLFPKRPQITSNYGGPCRDRTYDLLIKRQTP